METLQKKSNRSSKFILELGFPGTGKSTLMQKFIDLEVAKRKGRVLIVTPDPFEWKQYPIINLHDPECFHNIKGPTRLIYNEPSDIDRIADEYTGFLDGLLILDDCRFYLKPNIQDSFRKIIGRRRHRSHDIIAASHGFTEMPPTFFTYANEYALFYTQDNVERRKEEIGAYFDSVKQAVEDVNAQYQTNEHACIIIKARPNG